MDYDQSGPALALTQLGTKCLRVKHHLVNAEHRAVRLQSRLKQKREHTKYGTLQCHPSPPMGSKVRAPNPFRLFSRICLLLPSQSYSGNPHNGCG